MSSREVYQLPTQRDSSSGNNNAFTSFATGAAADASSGPAVSYQCGECNSKVELARGDAIRCNVCGHRVLYKERTKRMVQFEAR